MQGLDYKGKKLKGLDFFSIILCLHEKLLSITNIMGKQSSTKTCFHLLCLIYSCMINFTIMNLFDVNCTVERNYNLNKELISAGVDGNAIRTHTRN